MPYETIKRFSIAWGVLMFLSACAFGQDYPMKHYTVEDGLPSNTVYNVYRDHKGFLWFCTDKGVARYNGLKFERFTTSNGLTDNEVFLATEDTQDRLWFSALNGKLCYYKNDTFHNPENTPFLRQKHKHTHLARVFCEDDGTTSISFLDGNYFCNISDNKLIEIRPVNDIIEATTDNIWHVKKVDSVNYRVLASSHVVTVNISASPKIVNVEKLHGAGGAFNKLGRIWTSTKGQDQPWLFYLDSVYCSVDLKNIKRYPPGTKIPACFSVRLVHTDHVGNTFCLTDHGMYINDSAHVLANENISFMTQDVNNNYWISTLGNGVFCLDRHFTGSRFFKNVYKDRLTFTTEVNGKLFYTLDNHRLHVLQNGVGKPLFTPIYRSEDKPWYNSSSAGEFVDTDLTYYHFRGHHCYVVSNVLSQNQDVKLHFFDHCRERHAFKKVIKVGGRLYLNTGFSVRSMDLSNYINGDSVKLTRLPDSKGERIFALASKDNGEVWYSSVDSLFRVKDNVAIPHNEYGRIAFKNFGFFGKYLVGFTQGNQLEIYETRDGRTKKYTEQRDCIWEGLHQLDSSHILISTNDIYYLLALNSAQTGAPYTLSALEDAVIPIQPEAICVGQRDCFFFKNGNITSIPKSQLLEKNAAPVLYFTRIETSKGIYRIAETLRIPYNESERIAIAFSTVSFSGNAPMYQYSMTKDGEDNWINIKGDVINLSNPRFGSYIVKVRAKTASSDYSDAIQFKVTILRPFWATWWFLSSIGCVAGLLVWVIVRRRIRRQMKHKEKEHENHVRFIRSEYKAMNALMNPHFVFNSINNVQGLVNNHDVMNATEYLGIFADLLRQNMHNISNDTISLQKEIDLVENYLLLEKLRFEDQLSYSINIADNMFLSDIMVPPLLLQPLVENAIKHGILPLKSRGKQGHLHINIYEQDDALIVEVKDNGIGIAKAQEKRSLHQSYGLSNIRNRIKQLSIIQGKEIFFELTEATGSDGSSAGTVARIRMPLT